MDESAGYEIRVVGVLPAEWSDWLGGLAVEEQADGTTLLRGAVSDQAALLGLLAKLHGLNLALISVNRTDRQQPAEATGRGAGAAYGSRTQRKPR